MEHKIIDSFLPDIEFRKIKDLLLGSNFPWYYADFISGSPEDLRLYCFMHSFFCDYSVKSDAFYLVRPILDKLKVTALHRFKANCYPNINKHIQHGVHVDMDTPHKGAVFYVNTNNGFTVLENGTKIESIENRILLFDASKPHASTSCTDKKTRVTVNLNYF